MFAFRRFNSTVSTVETVANVANVAKKQTISKNWAFSKKDGQVPCFKMVQHKYRDLILNGTNESNTLDLRYHSVAGMEDAFDLFYERLKKKAQVCYDQIDEINTKLSSEQLSEQERASLNQQKLALEVDAEIKNPEVLANFQFNDKVDNNPQLIDYSKTIYRKLARDHWESYDLMITMQRLEQMAVIPDTLPTLDPRCDVKMKFLNHSTQNAWIEPGVKLSTNVTSFAPSFKIQEFDQVDPQKQMYTILIVNPDVPDVPNDSYKTEIVYGLSNIKIGYNDNFVGPQRLATDSSINQIIEYAPPVPDRNLGPQRYCVWVFRQPNTISDKLADRAFDLRQYAKQHELTAVGAHLWRSEWDLNTESVRKLYGMPEGTIYTNKKTFYAKDFPDYKPRPKKHN